MRRGATVLLLTALAAQVYRPAQAGETKFPRFCLTIALGLRADRREEVSAIDLKIQNASVVSIPRFPLGWGIRVQNYVDNTPATIFGGATGSVAELRTKDLQCLFELENSVPGAPAITITGSVNVSNGETEHRMLLQKSQIVLEKIKPP